VYDQRGLDDLGSSEVKSADMERNVEGASRIEQGRILLIRSSYQHIFT
jgi:hypothetical protein